MNAIAIGLFALVLAFQPAILWFLTTARSDRKDLKTALDDINQHLSDLNGKVGRHDEWIRIFERQRVGD